MTASAGLCRASPARPIVVAVFCCTVMLAGHASAWAARTVTGVEVRTGDHETLVAVCTSEQQPLGIKSFVLAEPPRLVFDLLGAELGPELPDSLPIAAPAFEQIRLGQFSSDPPIARVVAELAGEVPTPAYAVAAGSEPGETLIVLPNAEPVVLDPPTIETVEGAVLVRIAGAGHLRHSVGALAEPPRVYADLTDAVIEEGCRQAYDEGSVREIRLGQQPAESTHPVARVVVELHEEGQAHTMFREGRDLVLALASEAWALPLPAYSGAERLKGKRIVLDPGHGGDDIGAPATFGRRDTSKGPYEKDIVMDLAQRLARLLKAEEAAVTLTRDDDSDPSLEARAAVANRRKAHALISLHCNSCDRPNTLHGTSVYYDHQHSAKFAALVQEELIAALGTEDKGVRNANFAVIRRAKVPGVLVETAFINHAGDRARLAHPNFRERAARAVMRGLIRFFGGDPGEDAPT